MPFGRRLQDVVTLAAVELHSAKVADLAEERLLQATEGTDLSFTNGFCDDLVVQEVLLTSESLTDDAVGVNVMVTRLTGICTGVLEFDLVGSKGTADFEAYIVFDSLDADLLLISEVEGGFPNTGCLAACESMVTVESLEIDNVQMEDGNNEELFGSLFDQLEDRTALLLETLGEESK